MGVGTLWYVFVCGRGFQPAKPTAVRAYGTGMQPAICFASGGCDPPPPPHTVAVLGQLFCVALFSPLGTTPAASLSPLGKRLLLVRPPSCCSFTSPLGKRLLLVYPPWGNACCSCIPPGQTPAARVSPLDPFVFRPHSRKQGRSLGHPPPLVRLGGCFSENGRG